MNAWYTMHGYGLYIWPAYALVFAVLWGNGWRASWRAKQVRMQLERWIAEE